MITKVTKKGHVIGHVECIGKRYIGHSNNHNMKELFGRDVFKTEEEAIAFVRDLNEEDPVDE